MSRKLSRPGECEGGRLKVIGYVCEQQTKGA